MGSNSMLSKKNDWAYKEEEEEEDEEVEDGKITISNQIRLKPGRPSEKLDKEVVLRRIRHRIRVNKFKNAVQSLFTSPFSSSSFTGSSNGKKISGQQLPRRWVDDPFAAL